MFPVDSDNFVSKPPKPPPPGVSRIKTSFFKEKIENLFFNL
jgi:hypothetical protein